MNQTNKDIITNQFDLNVKSQKGNVTLQYDNVTRGSSVVGKYQKSRPLKINKDLKSKSQEKKRHHSQSAPHKSL